MANSRMKLIGIGVFVVLILILGVLLVSWILEGEDPGAPNQPHCIKRLVAYYSGSNALRPDQLTNLTHLLFIIDATNHESFFTPDKLHWQFNKTKHMARDVNPAIKIMISVKNYHTPFYEDIFLHYSNSSELRETLASSIATFLTKHDLDGIDLRWKLKPEGTKSFAAHFHLNNEEIPDEAIKNQILFLKELRHRLKSSIISLYVPPVGPILKKLNFMEYSKYVDFINVGTADYVDWFKGGPYNYSIPPSPLYAGSGPKELNVNWTVSQLACRVQDLGFVNLEVPFYLLEWEKKEDGYHVYAKTSWSDSLLRNWMDHFSWDNETMTPYKAKNSNTLKYENPKSLGEKMKFILEHNLGGVTIVNLDMDHKQRPLLRPITQAKWCADQAQEVKYNCDN